MIIFFVILLSMTGEVLLNEYQSLMSEADGLRNKVRHYENYIAHLEEAVQLLRHRGFAPKSEKLEPQEEQLYFDEIETEAGRSPAADESEQLDLVEVAGHKKRRPKRKKLPKDLPREQVIVELPESDRRCPHDGTELKVIGRESSERIDVIPMQMKVVETLRLKYACPCCEGYVKTAPVLPSLVPKGLPTAGTLSFIATSKFCDGLSLYHLEKMFARNGVEISRGSMAHWMIRVHGGVQPLLNLLEEELLSDDYVQIDETPVQVLKEEGKKAQTLSYMWVRTRPHSQRPIILFDYDPTRSGKVAEKLLEEFTGRLQCDGFSGYDRLEQKPHIIRHGCFAHARRKLFEAAKVTKKANIAKHALKLVQKLYRIEEKIRGKPADEIFRVRQIESKPLLDELKAWVDQNKSRVPPKSATGKALMYLQNEWKYLARYTEDGRVHIDNNFIENKIRPFAIGRKRWLFSDTVSGAQASAALYSLVETAKANGLEPYRYLRFLFEKLPQAETLSDFEGLLPWNAKI